MWDRNNLEMKLNSRVTELPNPKTKALIGLGRSPKTQIRKLISKKILLLHNPVLHSPTLHTPKICRKTNKTKNLIFHTNRDPFKK